MSSVALSLNVRCTLVRNDRRVTCSKYTPALVLHKEISKTLETSMDELFLGYQPQTPQFRVLQTVKTARRQERPAARGLRTRDGDREGVTTIPSARERGKRGKKADPRESRTLFVGNLPPTITRRRVRQLFSQHGRVESVRLRSIVVEKGRLPVRVAKRKHAQISSAAINSYVVFADEEDARKALELNGTCVANRHIRVDMATREDHAHDRSVFVGALPYDIDDEELRASFEKFGDVESVRVVREQKTGNGKGFGFVTFRERSGVLFSLQNRRVVEVKGHRVRVMKSRDVSFARERANKKVPKFSGTQVEVKTAVSPGKERLPKRERYGTVEDKKPAVAKGKLSSGGKGQSDKVACGERKAAGSVKASLAVGVRPSRTFHKKKEARRREREERKRKLPGQRKRASHYRKLTNNYHSKNKSQNH